MVTRTRQRGRFLAVLVGVAAVGVLMLSTSIATDAEAQTTPSTEFRWESDLDHPVGLGTSGFWTLTGYQFTTTSTATGGVIVYVEDVREPQFWWSVEFEAPHGEPLTVGTYTSAVQSNDDPTRPVLFARHNNLQCSTSPGSLGAFEILELETQTFAGMTTVTTFAADFQLGCAGGPLSQPQAVGSIRIDSAVPIDTDRTVSGVVTDELTGDPIEFVLVCLVDPFQGVETCAFTDSDGLYAITVDPGTYYVSFGGNDTGHRVECFSGQGGCVLADYLDLTQSFYVNHFIDASMELGCENQAATIVGDDGDNVLTGTEGDDVIVGLGGNDVISGLGGNDLICSGAGIDNIVAGDGDDHIHAGPGDDIVYGQNGDDLITGFTGNNKLRGGDGNDEIFGNSGIDDISGGRDNDVIFGREGDDVLRGGTGDDELDGGEGNDYMNGNGGEDIVDGGPGDDVYVGGGPRPDTVMGGDGDDFIKGLGGADAIFGEAGNDEIYGGDQPDAIDGGIGEDFCNGGAKTDTHQNCETAENM